jgi:hypothetical protein
LFLYFVHMYFLAHFFVVLVVVVIPSFIGKSSTDDFCWEF